MLENLSLEKGECSFRVERCLLRRNSNINCGRCLSVCPVEAIELGSGGISFSSSRCQNCGACRAICPSEAFTVKNFSFLKELHSLKLEKLTIGCTLNAANRRDFNVSCYALLTEGELLYLLTNKKCLTFCISNCEHCDFKEGYKVFLKAVSHVWNLVQDKGKILLSQEGNNQQGISRRLLFQWFRQRAITVVSETIPAKLNEPITSLPGRRKNLLLGIENFSGNISEKLFIQEIKACSSCIGCGGCVNLCPQKAFALLNSKLYWQGKTCLNCGLCLATCPEKALYFAEPVLRTELWEKKILKYFLGRRCSLCGNYFEGEEERCAKCTEKQRKLELSFNLGF